MLDHELVLKCNELCLIGKEHSFAAQNESGLFARDTRFLSELSLTLGDLSLEVLTMQEISPTHLRIYSTNMRRTDALQPHEIVVVTNLILGTELTVNMTAHNYSRIAFASPMTLLVAADFLDMFEVRGIARVDSVVPQPIVREGAGCALSALASDGVMLTTTVAWSGDPAVRSWGEDISGVELIWQLDLAAGDMATHEVVITPVPHGAPFVMPPLDDPQHLFTTAAPFATGDSELDDYLNSSDRDLALLQTSFPEGAIPAAGIPWFIAPFGRDSMITCLQTMHRYPYRAQSALWVLASLQGEKIDPYREEQPGKIAHEMRYGELSRRGRIPHTPYYGSIDATPLFLMTLVACDAVLQDDAFFAEMRPHAERAFAWIEQYGDLDGDGLIEFAGKQEDAAHISQQGWKDSFDSLHFADGREVKGPIALVEPQAYVYAAYAGYAEALARRGEDDSAFRARAERLREVIERLFWMEDVGFYAQALDGDKQPVDAISSNAGHVLFCGVPSEEHATSVAARLAQPDMNGGWGIRTLSSEMATYNPISYHNGSVWPHDVSLGMMGLYRYGHIEQAQTIARQLVKLAGYDPRRRLAELYGGYADDGNGPVPYPVSCSPQAWAAGAGMLVAQVLTRQL